MTESVDILPVVRVRNVGLTRCPTPPPNTAIAFAYCCGEHPPKQLQILCGVAHHPTNLNPLTQFIEHKSYIHMKNSPGISLYRVTRPPDHLVPIVVAGDLLRRAMKRFPITFDD